jgi:mannose-1-phosphate guanylyltransferase
VKNPPGNLANAAVYILAPSVVAFVEGLGKDRIDFSTEILPRYIGRINTFENETYHRDIGTPQSLQTARAEYPLVARRAGPRVR